MKSISEASIKRHETDPLLRKKHVSAKINKISPKQSVQNNQAGQGGVGRGGTGRGGAERGGMGWWRSDLERKRVQWWR